MKMSGYRPAVKKIRFDPTNEFPFTGTAIEVATQGSAHQCARIGGMGFAFGGELMVFMR